MKLLVTGSSGLVGSEVCSHFSTRGWKVNGVDSNERAVFFGKGGDTDWNRRRLERELSDFEHHAIDIRDREGVRSLVASLKPDAIVHAAAQPSHDLAARIPFADFDTNAGGTLNLLEAVRQECPESPFVFLSTNKVYGDRPNWLVRVENEKRFDFADPEFENGIPEDFPIDQSTHSLFGASKIAADVLVQEYGRYFGMPTCCLRGGCLTGSRHSGVPLHGFLSYLVRCNIEEKEYEVIGYGGKQVRDNLHATDVAAIIDLIIQAPQAGAVYNLGGGRENSCSILEAFELAEAATGKPQRFRFIEENRIGDHICYYSDLRKLRSDYPAWEISMSLPDIFADIAAKEV